MRMQLLKIVVVLLVAGSGDTRPQNGADSQVKMTERNDAGWRGIQVSSKSHDIVRDDSRYTGTSGNNRKLYLTHFRDSADSSRGYNAVGKRASGLAPDATSRSLSARRSKIDGIWTMPEFRAMSSPPHFQKTDMLGETARATAVQNMYKVDRPSFHALSSNSKMIQNDRIGWRRFSPDLKVGRTDYSAKMNTGNFERSKSGVTSNDNLESVVAQTRYSYSAGNRFLATHSSDYKRTNDDISVALENRRKSNSIRPDSFANKIGGETSRRKLDRDVNRSSLSLARTDSVPSDSHADAATRVIHKDRNSIRTTTDSIAISYKNSKPGVVTDSSRHIGGSQRDDLNNSGSSANSAEPASIPNSKSDVVGHNRSSAFTHRNALTSHRNFVKLRYPYSTVNRWNASNYAVNTKMKNVGNYVGSTGIQLKQPAKSHLTRTSAKKPVGSNNHATSKPFKSSHSSSVQKSPSQEIDGGSKTGDKHGDTTVKYDTHLKNWPNDVLQDIEDLYNYEKYTSSLEEESSHESDLSNEKPILSSNNYFDHTDPILDSSVKKIIHWLKVPAIIPNSTQFFNYNDDKPIEPVFESIYENLEPNRPLSISSQDNYESVVPQDVSPSQDLDKIDYPTQWSSPSSTARPQYATDSPPAASIPSSWPGVSSLQNKTIYNPLTHVTQNTVVHILNDGLKKPNVTVTQLKAPETDAATADHAATSSESTSDPLVQRPNVHIMFTSQKDEDKEPSKQETGTVPSSIYNPNCPTILVNTYTRVNNTIESKEGCTDLNIIVNSHVTNTNVFTPSGRPTNIEEQQTSLATQGYGDVDESEKHTDVFTDLSLQDSLDSYVTASAGTYGSNPLETPLSNQHDYYDFPKDPSEISGNNPVQSSELSTVEVFQGTQISVAGSTVPLANAEVTASPVGSSVDGSAVGPDDTSSSVVNPPAAGASSSGPSVAGSLGTENLFPGIDPELPVYLVKPGPVKGQANNVLVPGSLQLPALPSISIQSGKPSSSIASSSLSPTSGSEDDDDDDDFDMTPSGVLEYMTTTFTYFSLLNPLSYGFFSFSAAPFVAMAAGVLGVAAFIFPWTLPSVFDIGRSAYRTIGFAPNLEEFVRRAVHKYDRLNKWKRRRRKRRR